MRSRLDHATNYTLQNFPWFQSVLPVERENRDPMPSDPAGMWTSAVNSITKQRMLLNMKLLGPFGIQTAASHIKENKPTYREQFLPPEMSMISYFLSKVHPSNDLDRLVILSGVRQIISSILRHYFLRIKIMMFMFQPSLPDDAADVDYDSAGSEQSDEEEEEDEDVFDGETTKGKDEDLKDNTEHSNPSSYSWAVMRLAVLRIMQKQLQEFLTVAGIELQGTLCDSVLVESRFYSFALEESC